MNEQQSKRPITDLFHDCGYIYISTIEPAVDEPVTVLLRTVKGNVTHASVEITYEGVDWQSFDMTPDVDDETGYFKFFKCTIPGQNKMFKYRFRAGNDDPANDVYYTRTYVGKDPVAFDERVKSLQADNYWTLIPGYHTPDWAKGVIWYSVMPDAFYNGDITNDEPGSSGNCSVSWNMSQHTLGHKYGGDLKGVEKKLDHIKGIGCEALFMDPIFKSTQDAGYGPEFYKQLENSFGNKKALVDLARNVHERGMHYMIDVVFAFVAVHDIWYNKDNTNPFPAAAQDWNSKYHDFFYFTGEEGDTGAYKSQWGGVELNHASEFLCDLLYRNKDSYLQYYCSSPFDVDAIRYDCGGSLYGIKEDGTRIGADEVVGKMRPYLREINPEMLMLSEYSMYYSVDTGSWDSRWNLEFVKYGYPYMQGELSESFMFERYDNEMHNVPRAFGLCQYNSMNDHDRPRSRGVKPYAFKALQLIHMTEVGSPCIYYGDEIKLERDDGHTFYGMDWNEANWDYKVLHNTMALTELRKKYTAVRKGIIKYLAVDDVNNILAFARKDENGTVITVARRRESTYHMSLNVRDLSEVDGTVFTDWFTGKHYTARDGFIDVEIPAGGTIFVKGEDSASHKGGFSIDNIGGAEAVVTVPEDDGFVISGKGSIGDDDSLVFVNNDVFNTFSVSAKTNGGVIMARGGKDTDSTFIAASVKGKRLTVYARLTDGAKVKRIASADIEKGSYVMITRDAENRFAVKATKTLGNLWDFTVNNVLMRMPHSVMTVVDGLHIDMSNHAYAGVSALDGGEFTNVNVSYDKNCILCDDFTKGDTAMFDYGIADRSYSKSGITLTPAGAAAEILSYTPDEDWTFKTAIKFVGAEEGDCAGVICRQDDDIAVFAGRMIVGGKQMIVFGRETDGKLAVYYSAEDTLPNNKLTVQLQRIGTAYSAVYTYNGKAYKRIGKDIIANLCNERAGLAVDGVSSATFKYACFGNSIEDGVSFNTPTTPDIGKLDFSGIERAKKYPLLRYVSGDWDYSEEGFIQRSKKLSQMGIEGKEFGGFKVDATYLIDEGKGFVGFEFSKKSFDSPLGDGVLVSLTDKGTLSVTKGKETYCSIELGVKTGEDVKIAAEYRNNVLAIFAGNDGTPVLMLNDFCCPNGYVAFFTEGVTAHVNNYLEATFDTPVQYVGDYTCRENGTVRNDWEFMPVFFNPIGIAATNFVASVRITPEHFANFEKDAYMGLSVCAPEGRARRLGYLFGIDRNNNFIVRIDGKTVNTTKPSNIGKYTDIMVVKQGDSIKAYVNGAKEPIYELTDAHKNGGAFTFVNERSTALYSKYSITDTGVIGNPEASKAYKNWMK